MFRSYMLLAGNLFNLMKKIPKRSEVVKLTKGESLKINKSYAGSCTGHHQKREKINIFISKNTNNLN